MMHGRMHRRALLASIAGVSLIGLAGRASANEAVLTRLFREGVIIDGNIAPPMDDAAPLDALLTAQVAASGLTAAKVTVVGPGTGYADTIAMLDAMDKGVGLNPAIYANPRTVAEIEALRGKGRVGLIWSFETTEMFEGKVERIDEFARRGVRVMQLSYNGASPFGSGVMIPADKSTGLTPLGREAIARMEAAGVSLDLSHSDERSTLDALAAATKPAMITHAGCSGVHPHPRNKSDRVLKAVADKGGVFGIYDLSFLTPDRPAQPTTDEYMVHLMHALKVCGEDHVGVGSDAILTGFDASPESMKDWNEQTAARKTAGVAAPEEGRPPYVEGLNSSERMKVIAAELLKRGVSERAAGKILGGNFLRVFRETWGQATFQCHPGRSEAESGDPASLHRSLGPGSACGRPG